MHSHWLQAFEYSLWITVTVQVWCQLNHAFTRYDTKILWKTWRLSHNMCACTHISTQPCVVYTLTCAHTYTHTHMCMHAPTDRHWHMHAPTCLLHTDTACVLYTMKWSYVEQLYWLKFSLSAVQMNKLNTSFVWEVQPFFSRLKRSK